MESIKNALKELEKLLNGKVETDYIKITIKLKKPNKSKSKG